MKKVNLMEEEVASFKNISLLFGQDIIIARNGNGELFLYDNIPFKDEENELFYTMNNESKFSLDRKLFPSITFSNSPVRKQDIV